MNGAANMKIKIITTLGLIIAAAAVSAQAQSDGQQTLAGTLNIYVFPAQGRRLCALLRPAF